MSTFKERFLTFVKNELDIKKQEGTFPEHAESSEYYKEKVEPKLLTCEALFKIALDEMGDTLSNFSLYSWYFQDEMGPLFADTRKHFTKNELQDELSFLPNADEIVNTVYYPNYERDDDKNGYEWEWFKEINPDKEELIDETVSAILYLNRKNDEKINSVETFQERFNSLGLDANCVEEKRMSSIIQAYNNLLLQKENNLSLEATERE